MAKPESAAAALDLEDKLRRIAASFTGRRVLVIGDVMLDEYIWGEVRRISPEAPVPIVAVRRRSSVPGGAGNTAINIASLGGLALLGCVVGRDAQAARLSSTMGGQGLILDGVLVDEERATTTKTRIVAHHQHVVRIDEEQATPLALKLEDQMLRWLEGQIPGVDACVLSDYAKGVVSPRLAQHLIGLAKQAGKPVVVDPKGMDFQKYRGATVVKPNLEEAKAVYRAPSHHEPALADLANNLMEILAGSALLLTRGAEGMSLYQQGSEPLHIPSVAREVFDVTGAGDTVAGTLALALGAGANLVEAAQLANLAAGVVVGKVGTAQATREELFASR
jgi:rfaE bifunctional protein kinase chain/domain